jgi:hypothetical protein
MPRKMAAPPVFRPQPAAIHPKPGQPGALQRKQSPVSPARSTFLRAVQLATARIAAPPVYRPQRAAASAPPAYRPIQPKRGGVMAPPVYRPGVTTQPRIQPGVPKAARGWVPGTAPPPYRPNVTGTGVGQAAPARAIVPSKGAAQRSTAPAGAAVPPRLRANTIQRAVGFEFETGWIVERQDKGMFTTSYVAMKKKDLIFQGDGFRVEADEATAEGQKAASEIEFVIDPPIEDSYDAETELRAIMAGVTNFARQLEQSGASGQPFLHTTSAGTFRITPPRDKKVIANPQVTAGVRLDRIPEMASQPTSAPRSALIANPGITDDLSRYAETARKEVKSRGGSEQLVGFITMVLHYLHSWAADAPERIGYYSYSFEYIKSGPALMARTDFGALYSRLSREDRDILESGTMEKDSNFARTILRLAGLQPFEKVVERGVRKPVSEELTTEFLSQKHPGLINFPGPDRADWLTNMQKGKDLMSGKTNPELYEGMGALGSKVDEVGILDQNKSWGAIIEFRKGEAKVSYDKWTDFAVNAYNYIYQLNNPGERRQVEAVRQRLDNIFSGRAPNIPRNTYGHPGIGNDRL